MSDPTVDRWCLEGRLYLWRFDPPRKDWEGWHLSGDSDACRSLVDLVERMWTSEWPTRRTIPVTVPERLRVGGGHPWKLATALRLCYPKGDVEDSFWRIELGAEETLTLTLGSETLRELQKALRDLPAWKDDYPLGPTNDKLRRAECLWLWTRV